MIRKEPCITLCFFLISGFVLEGRNSRSSVRWKDPSLWIHPCGTYSNEGSRYLPWYIRAINSSSPTSGDADQYSFQGKGITASYRTLHYPWRCFQFFLTSTIVYEDMFQNKVDFSGKKLRKKIFLKIVFSLVIQ